MRINPENIDQEMLVDAIAGSQEFMDDTAPPSQSQQPLIPLFCGRSRTRTLGLGFSGFFQFKTTNDSFFSQAGK
jgi:hypothetical protein